MLIGDWLSFKVSVDLVARITIHVPTKNQIPNDQPEVSHFTELDRLLFLLNVLRAERTKKHSHYGSRPLLLRSLNPYNETSYIADMTDLFACEKYLHVYLRFISTWCFTFTILVTGYVYILVLKVREERKPASIFFNSHFLISIIYLIQRMFAVDLSFEACFRKKSCSYVFVLLQKETGSTYRMRSNMNELEGESGRTRTNGGLIT